MDAQTRSETVSTVVTRLVNALLGLGLSAEPFGASMVWAVNRAADPDGGNARAVQMSPGLRQAVQCRADEMGQLGWYWVWTFRGERPTYEWFAPVNQINTAAEKVARVLALHPQGVS